MESNLKQLLVKLTSALDALSVQYCLVGGFAIAYRAEPRLTRDIDFAVVTDTDKNIENLIFVLRQSGFFLDTLLEHEGSSKISTVRLLNTEKDIGGLYADLLFFSSGIEKEIVENSTKEEIVPGVFIHIATIPYLIAMKVLAFEPKFRSRDKDDALSLIKEASNSELKLVPTLLDKITVQGLNRGKDLMSDFHELLKMLGKVLNK